MKQIVPLGLAAAFAASALAIAGYSVASAAAQPVLDPIEIGEFHSEPPPMPVSADPVIESEPENACIAVDRILGVFALDVQHVGGEILALGDGLQQAFADSWRRTVGLPSVTVTQVYAHIVTGEGTSVVDVVEIDGKGCAISRTLLSMDDWLEILKPLRSIEV